MVGLPGAGGETFFVCANIARAQNHHVVHVLLVTNISIITVMAGVSEEGKWKKSSKGTWQSASNYCTP